MKYFLPLLFFIGMEARGGGVRGEGWEDRPAAELTSHLSPLTPANLTPKSR